MITGFNTDIEYQGTTYHVQTEDKGLATPLILSLVYHRGTILASKRSPYDDLLKNFDEKALAERLQKQHQLICAAIRAGRIEDLKRMTEKESAAKRKAPNAQIEPKPPEIEKPKTEFPPPQVLKVKPKNEFQTRIIKEQPKIQPEIPSVKIAEAVKDKKVEIAARQQPRRIETAVPKPEFEPAIPKPKEDIGLKSLSEIVHSEPVIEAVQIIEDEIILPAEAVEIIADDSIIKSASLGKLQVKIYGDDNFKSGEKRTISIIVFRGSVQFASVGAQVMVKVIGSAFRPLIFHSKTDVNGVANVHLQMPQFKSGRAVLLIKAASDGEEAEFRRVIKHR